MSIWAISALVLSLRIAPVFAFAPPFTLIRVPTLVRVLLGVALSATMVSANQHAVLPDSWAPTIFVSAVRELGVGLMFTLAFHIAFAALYVAGRTVDIQAGFGLALLIDPTSKAQTPLVGTLFAYAAGLVFFAMDGHLQLLRLVASSLDVVPIGTWEVPGSIERVTALLSASFLLAFAVAGGTILTLWLVDLAIALMSRTVPQMNVLMLGFQVKTLVLLLALPTSFGMASALLLRLMSRTLEAIPEVL